MSFALFTPYAMYISDLAAPEDGEWAGWISTAADDWNALDECARAPYIARAERENELFAGFLAHTDRGGTRFGWLRLPMTARVAADAAARDDPALMARATRARAAPRELDMCARHMATLVAKLSPGTRARIARELELPLSVEERSGLVGLSIELSNVVCAALS